MEFSKLTDFDSFTGFEWDEGNDTKSWIKHNVSKIEAEQVFFNEPLLLYFDDEHSESENRYFVLGRTDEDRKLMIVFTKRKSLIRIISARDMSKKERAIYKKS